VGGKPEVASSLAIIDALHHPKLALVSVLFALFYEIQVNMLIPLAKKSGKNYRFRALCTHSFSIPSLGVVYEYHF
jgi:hypothetical protein